MRPLCLLSLLFISVNSSPLQGAPNAPDELTNLVKKVRQLYSTYFSKRELGIFDEVLEMYADAPEGKVKFISTYMTCSSGSGSATAEEGMNRKGNYDDHPIASQIRKLDVTEIKRFNEEPIKVKENPSNTYLEDSWVLHRRLPATPETLKCKVTIQLLKEEQGKPRVIKMMDLDCEGCKL